MSETLEQRLMRDAQNALKEQNKRKREILTTLLAIVKKARIDAAGKPFGPAEELSALEKAKKQREEAVEIYRQAGKTEQMNKELEEIEIIKQYLPEQLSEDEVKAIVQRAIAETGATTIKEMGKVMAIVQPQTKGRFSAEKVAQIVKQNLSQSS
ncbi:MAG: GatB/YqeY domain-containing protein [bacterium]|nr:GatB/YqeY domain-containing protein [bacterium]